MAIIFNDLNWSIFLSISLTACDYFTGTGLLYSEEAEQHYHQTEY